MKIPYHAVMALKKELKERGEVFFQTLDEAMVFAERTKLTQDDYQVISSGGLVYIVDTRHKMYYPPQNGEFLHV